MFSNKSDFNLHIEKLKIENGFDTYIETITYYIENESDQEPEQIAKHLNKKITEEIHKEANQLGMLKSSEDVVSLV